MSGYSRILEHQCQEVLETPPEPGSLLWPKPRVNSSCESCCPLLPEHHPSLPCPIRLRAGGGLSENREVLRWYRTPTLSLDCRIIAALVEKPKAECRSFALVSLRHWPEFSKEDFTWEDFSQLRPARWRVVSERKEGREHYT